ncbi:unnamed protein product [Boreogadus saida]
MNRDMEEKGTCTSGAELPDCRRAPRGGASSFGGNSAPGVHPPEQPESFGGSSAPGVRCRTEAEASVAARRLQRRPDCHRSFCGSPATPGVQSLSPPCLLLQQLRRGELSGSPAEKGIVLLELSCRAAAEFSPPELLVRWSQNHSYALIGGSRKSEVIFRFAPFLQVM